MIGLIKEKSLEMMQPQRHLVDKRNMAGYEVLEFIVDLCVLRVPKFRITKDLPTGRQALRTTKGTRLIQ
jgi:hypothetical protein